MFQLLLWLRRFSQFLFLSARSRLSPVGAPPWIDLGLDFRRYMRRDHSRVFDGPAVSIWTAVPVDPRILVWKRTHSAPGSSEGINLRRRWTDLMADLRVALDVRRLDFRRLHDRGRPAGGPWCCFLGCLASSGSGALAAWRSAPSAVVREKARVRVFS